MTNFRFGAAALGLTFAAIIATPALANVSTAVCTAEGGDVITVNGGEFCLVPIRPAEYAGSEYDGNQLGIVDCPGDKISDGAYCMAPITGGAKAVSSPVSSVAPTISTPTLGAIDASSVVESSTPSLGSVAASSVTSGLSVPSTNDLTTAATDAAKDAANDAIRDQAQKQTEKKAKGLLSGVTGK